MTAYSLEGAAERGGVGTDVVARLTQLGILQPGTNGYTDADVRRLQIVQTLERAGLPIDAVGQLVRAGRLSLGFIDAAGYQVFAPLGDETYAELSRRTGIELDLLMVMRDAVGGRQPSPDDRVRADELEILPLVEFQIGLGFRRPAIERALRAYGDSLRRIAEVEAEWFRSEIQDPIFAAGGTEDDVGRRSAEVSPELSALSDRALLAIFHAQQRHAWSTNIVGGIAGALERAGLHRREKRVPAMCFLDITGYTALTAELGDAAAAAAAERLGHIVQRIAREHGGRPVKWLGDGVMLHFPDPGPGVEAALRMLRAVPEAGLQAAHIGLHAGPVVLQEGDFYGQTVNLAARIGEYARPGEVLVSEEVVAAAGEAAVAFREVGAVELKGVGRMVRLFAAQPA